LLRPLLVNDVETGESEWYPELQPRRYRESYDDVLACARRAIEEGARFQLRSVSPERGRLEAEARTKLVGFVDDVTVISTVVHTVRDELDRFREWEQNHALPQ